MLMNENWTQKITLQELVNRQKLTGESDSSLIAEWFSGNNMALEGIDIVSKISKNKIENDEQMYGNLVGDLSMYGVTENIIKDFGIKDGVYLDHIIRNYIIYNRISDKDFAEIYPPFIDWLKSFIPTKNEPKVFWQPFAKYLKEKGIYFKDQNKGERDE